MEKGIATIDYKLCMACGVCVEVCPFSSLELGKIGIDSLNKAYPQLVLERPCTGCGLCVTACPVDCISLAIQTSKPTP